MRASELDWGFQMIGRSSFVALCAALAVAGCASTSAPSADGSSSAAGMEAAAAAAPDAPSNASTETFKAGLSATHDAAIAAAKESGFEIENDSATFISGPRPRKIGVFVGSGGETINISLSEIDASSTRVTIWTKRTFVGGAGQKSWNEPILSAMKASLGAGSGAN